MGEVYKEVDTRLDRTVAIKVLPEHVSADADLRQRLEREAKSISRLNHPHIYTLHDIGSQDGIDFLVMEYLEGDTLAQRLEKGALPQDRAPDCHPSRGRAGQGAPSCVLSTLASIVLTQRGGGNDEPWPLVRIRARAAAVGDCR